MTLIELMIALGISTLMMSAVIMLFSNVVGSLSNGRALVEVCGRLRTARIRLQLDLAGHTAPTIPPLRPEDGQGYFEIIEGPNWDNSGSWINPAGATINYEGTSGAGKKPFTNSIMGDADDILMLMVRSQDEPFVGTVYVYDSTTKITTTMTIESPTAEVAWFALPNGRTLPSDPNTNFASYTGNQWIQLYTLYRRVLLIHPTFVNANASTQFDATSPVLSGMTPAQLQHTYGYDLSVYPSPSPVNPTGSLPNTLSTLTARENRYYHQPPTAPPLPPATVAALPSSGYPFPLNTTTTNGLPVSTFGATSVRLGEDVILTDVLSFDIRVFDPLVAIKFASDGTALIPTDPGYASQATVGYGAFVDLGYSKYSMGSNNTCFSAAPNPVAKLSPAVAIQGLTIPASVLPTTYDTWSWSYEQNGIDEDDDHSPPETMGAVDEGTDGLDDDPGGHQNGIVDDPPQLRLNYGANPPTATITSVGERETLAPYPFPLRGVQIRIRVYEPDTRQVREVRVVQDFLPD